MQKRNTWYCNLKFNVPNEISVVFHNGSNYSNIKELANEFKQQFECLGENKEKHKIFSVPIKKKITKIDKDGNESVKAISYKIKFIDSMEFMTNSLSKLIDNLTERIHQIKCKDCNCFFGYESAKNDSLKYKCLSCNKGYSNKLD